MGVEFWHQAQVCPAKSKRGDVEENERDREISGHTLHGVTPRSIPAVSIDIGLSRSSEDDSQCSMKSNWAKENGPLNDLERRERMDKIYFVLKGLYPGVSILRLSKKPSPDNG